MADALTSFGGFKLMEEAGELVQALGKLGPFPADPHPDGGPPLRDRIEAESGDVMAAVQYFIEANGLDMEAVAARAAEKVAKFRKWGLTGFDGTLPPECQFCKGKFGCPPDCMGHYP